MPVKKKHAPSPAKKKQTIHKEEETPKVKTADDRPVMQVVQVAQEETSPVPPQTPSPSIPEKEISPVVTPVTVEEKPTETSTPVPATPEPVISVSPAPPEPAEKVPVATPQTPSNVVSGLPSAVSSPSMPVTETFSQELPPPSSSKKGTIILLVCILILLCAALGGFIYWKQGKISWPAQISLPAIFGPKPASKTIVTPTIVLTPTPTAAIVNKAAYMIQVLNGSGITGAASKAKDTLSAAGFSVSATGNATSSDFQKTEIAAKPTVDKAFLDALQAELGKTYIVSSTTASLSDQSSSDVVVTLGSQTQP